MTLDATVAGASANTYLTLAEADAIAATDLGRDVDAWNAAEDATKEAALIRAAIDLDAYKPSLSDTKFDADQARRFPRSTDASDADTPVPFLPARLLDAAFAQAKYRLANADAFVDARARRARGYSSFSGDDGSATISLHPDLEVVSLEAQTLLDVLLGVPSSTARRPRVVSVPLSTITEDDE